MTGRVDVLQAQAKELKGFEKEQMESRIANLKGRVGIIRVGGHTEAEIDEKKYRVDDAVAAVKAAQDGGIVAGGGVTLANIARIFDISNNTDRMVRDALLAPLIKILENADLYSDELVS